MLWTHGGLMADGGPERWGLGGSRDGRWKWEGAKCLPLGKQRVQRTRSFPVGAEGVNLLPGWEEPHRLSRAERRGLPSSQRFGCRMHDQRPAFYAVDSSGSVTYVTVSVLSLKHSSFYCGHLGLLGSFRQDHCQ